jgi:hypothetical protein
MMTMELRQEVWHTWVVAQRVWNVTWARPVCVTVQVRANDIRHALPVPPLAGRHGVTHPWDVMVVCLNIRQTLTHHVWFFH